MSEILHTDPDLVAEVKRTKTPISRSATGYGPKIPSGFMIRYGNRWHRVYYMVYGNSGCPYIVSGGANLHLDIDTSYRLEGL